MVSIMLVSQRRPGSLEILVAAFVLLTTVAGEGTTQCNSGLKYAVGKSYAYTFGTYSRGLITLSRQRGSFQPGVDINGTVEVTALSECEYILTLKDAALSSQSTDREGKAKETAKIAVDNSSLRFTMNNGQVEKIFMEESDPSWSMNLKKTILFMLQNKGGSDEKDAVIETSVFGECLTKYETVNGQLKKFTDLRRCGEGEWSGLLEFGVPYELPLVQNKPIFGFLRPDAYIQCSQSQEGGVISGVQCDSGHDVLKMTSSLKLKETKDSILAADAGSKLSVPSDLIYDPSTSYSKPMDDIAVQKVKELLTGLSSNDSLKGEIFIDLKKALARVSDLTQFLSHESLKDPANKKLFYEALAEVSSDEALHTCIEAAKKGELEKDTLMNLYFNMAFTISPGVKSLGSLVDLVKNISVTKAEGNDNQEGHKMELASAQSILLGASSLAYMYCMQENAKCLTEPAYKSLVDAIAGHVKIVDGAEEDLVITAFQALGNLEHLTPAAVEAISSIMTKDNVPEWAEIQALDAFRRDPCQSSLKANARKTLSSSKSDQLKIQAYLALSRCLESDDMTAIQEVLKTPTSAVSGFIGSHVRNLKDTSSPSKMYWKAALEKLTIPEDILSVHNNSRASKFMEYSTFNEKENLGFSADASLIFIPGQARPEFMSVNVTVDVYGRSFNLFEVGLSQKFLMKTKIFQGPEVPAEWCCLDQAIDAKDSYVRMFGTTISLSLESLMEHYKNIKITTTGENPSVLIEILRPNTILDDSLVFPTISGLPLSFEASAVKLMSGQLKIIGVSDLSQLFNSEKPSYDYKFSGQMESDAVFKGSVGLGAETPLHTGYGFEGKISKHSAMDVAISAKTGPQLDADVKITFPNQIMLKKEVTVDAFGFEDVEGKMVKLRQIGDKALLGESLTTQPHRCFNIKALGLRTCQAWRNDHAFPLLFRSTFEKESPEMEGYDIKLKPVGPEEYKLTIITPGSKTHRSLELSYKSTADYKDDVFQWGAAQYSVQAELEKSKYSGKLVQNFTRHGMDYNVEYAAGSAHPTTLIKLGVDVNQGNVNVTGSFGGPLEPLGTIKYSLEQEYSQTHSEYYGPWRTRVSKNFTWDSKRFGKTSAEVDYTYLNHTPAFSATVKRNNEVYGVSYFSEYQQDMDTNFQEADGSVIKGQRSEEKHVVTVRCHSKKYVLVAAAGVDYFSRETYVNNFGILFNGTDGTDAWANVKYGIHKDTLSYSNKVSMNGKVLMSTSGSSNYQTNQYEFTGMLKDIGNLHGNLTLGNDHIHLYADVNNTREHDPVKITLVSDCKAEGAEVTQQTDFTVKNRVQESKFKVRTVANYETRNFDGSLNITSDKSQRTFTAETHASWPHNIMNGTTRANLKVKDEQGDVYTGSYNHSVASTDNTFASDVSADFHWPKEDTPWTYTSAVKVDNKNPNEKYDTNVIVTSREEVKGKILNQLLDVVSEYDVEIYKEKDKNVIGVIYASNVSDGAKQMMSTALNLVLNSDDDWESGIIKAEGHATNPDYKNALDMQIEYEGKPETQEIQRVSFNVDQTDRKTNVTKNIINGMSNSTFAYAGPRDFEMTGTGHAKVNGESTYHWDEYYGIYENHLNLFKEVTVVKMDGTEDTLFFMNIEAKLVKGNHQDKLLLTSQHSLTPGMPINNMTFALSR